jgi:hypothetical protein
MPFYQSLFDNVGDDAIIMTFTRVGDKLRITMAREYVDRKPASAQSSWGAEELPSVLDDNCDVIFQQDTEVRRAAIDGMAAIEKKAADEQKAAATKATEKAATAKKLADQKAARKVVPPAAGAKPPVKTDAEVVADVRASVDDDADGGDEEDGEGDDDGAAFEPTQPTQATMFPTAPKTALGG